MPNYGPNCVGCGGEDCVCCSTYLDRDTGEGEPDWEEMQQQYEAAMDKLPEDLKEKVKEGELTLKQAEAIAQKQYRETDCPDTPLAEQFDGE